MLRGIAIGLVALVAALPCFAADDDKWSTVKGKIVFDDSKQPIPKRAVPNTGAAPLPACVAKDKDFLTDEWIVDPKSKGVKDAYVWLMPEPTADEWKRLKSKDKDKLRDIPSFKVAQIHPDLQKFTQPTVEMDQPCCRFIPHALGVRVGQTVVIKNSAAFPHNAKWSSDNNGEKNPIIPEGKQETFPINALERNAISISCSIHPWMKASIRVFDHPYFAITDEKGDYEIKKAPVGPHRIFIFHPATGFLGKAEGRMGYELTVVPKSTEVKNYALPPDDPPGK